MNQLFHLIRSLELAIGFCISLFTRLIPGNRNCWIFGAWYGERYSDNSKAVFEYVKENEKHIKAVWVTKKKAVYMDLKSKNIPVVFAYSLFGILLQMKSGVCVYTHDVESDFYAPAVPINAFRVFLWHGIPLKKIGKDNEKVVKAEYSLLIKNWVFPFLTKRIDLACASSKYIANVYARAFDIGKKNVEVTGKPSTDFVFKHFNVQNNSKDQRKILYAPTFRKEFEEYDFFGSFIDEVGRLDRQLEKQGMNMSVRLHPVNHFTKDTLKVLSVSKNIEIEKRSELNEVLPSYSILLTDFSGVMFDFMLMNKPLYFLPLDLNDYLNRERSLYVKYKKFTSGQLILGWEELIDRLPELKNQICKGSNYNNLLSGYGGDIFDGKNSTRVFQAIKKRCKGKIMES